MNKDCTALYLACAPPQLPKSAHKLHFTLFSKAASYSISFSDFEDPSTKPLFSSQDRDRNRQHYPFVFDCLATRKQAAAYVGGSKVFLLNCS